MMYVIVTDKVIKVAFIDSSLTFDAPRFCLSLLASAIFMTIATFVGIKTHKGITAINSRLISVLALPTLVVMA